MNPHTKDILLASTWTGILIIWITLVVVSGFHQFELSLYGFLQVPSYVLLIVGIIYKVQIMTIISAIGYKAILITFGMGWYYDYVGESIFDSLTTGKWKANTMAEAVFFDLIFSISLIFLFLWGLALSSCIRGCRSTRPSAPTQVNPTPRQVDIETCFGSEDFQYGEDEICCICLCEFDQSVVYSYCCPHVFHRDCIKAWLDMGKISCPLCLATFSAKV